MTKRIKSILLIATLAVVTVGASAQFGKLLKGGGIAYLVSKFGPEINKGLNSITKTNNVGTDYDTKVVPIISAGSGNYAGAVQVAGPKDQIEKVQACAQLEGKFNPLGIRYRALIPIATKGITNIKRVPGVGISGIVDIKL